MRVIAGSVGGRRLKRPPTGIRPTSDLVRGAIFDQLTSRGVDLTRVLDLYAGTGALGIEALSRGGGLCDFVERSALHAALIEENLRLLALEARGRVHNLPVERALDRLRGPYALVLADPPYNDEAAAGAIERIATTAAVGPDTTLVLELSTRDEAPERLGQLKLSWSRRYGDTQVAVYRCPDKMREGGRR